MKFQSGKVDIDMGHFKFLHIFCPFIFRKVTKRGKTKFLCFSGTFRPCLKINKKNRETEPSLPMTADDSLSMTAFIFQLMTACPYLLMTLMTAGSLWLSLSGSLRLFLCDCPCHLSLELTLNLVCHHHHH